MDYGVLIRQLQSALGGKSSRSGVAFLTFAGSTSPTAAATVTHGLGKLPGAILIGNPYINGVVAVTGFYETNTITTTQFTLSGVANVAFTGSIAVSWEVVG